MKRIDEGFSVAVNAWNRSLVIGETLEAIFQQTLQPAEIVVLDDGSTDETGTVVKSFGSKVRLIRSENVGPGLSRDHAVRLCTQPWVALCDSDDIWSPSHLATLAEIRSAEPAAVAVFTNSDYFGSNAPTGSHFSVIPEQWWERATEKTFEKQMFTLRKCIYLDLATDNPVYTSCLAFKLATYHAMGGANPAFSRRNSEDADITRKLALEGPLAGSRQITVSIRKDGDNFSIDYARNLRGNYDILMQHVSSGMLPHDYVAPTKEAAAQCAHKAFRQAFWAGDHDFARECAGLQIAGLFDLRDRLRLLIMRLESVFR